LIHPDDLEKHTDGWSIKTGNKHRLEIPLKNKAGDYRWFVLGNTVTV
jgi:hypothetical protein